MAEKRASKCGLSAVQDRNTRAKRIQSPSFCVIIKIGDEFARFETVTMHEDNTTGLDAPDQITEAVVVRVGPAEHGIHRFSHGGRGEVVAITAIKNVGSPTSNKGGVFVAASQSIATVVISAKARDLEIAKSDCFPLCCFQQRTRFHPLFHQVFQDVDGSNDVALASFVYLDNCWSVVFARSKRIFLPAGTFCWHEKPALPVRMLFGIQSNLQLIWPFRLQSLFW